MPNSSCSLSFWDKKSERTSQATKICLFLFKVYRRQNIKFSLQSGDSEAGGTLPVTECSSCSVRSLLHGENLKLSYTSVGMAGPVVLHTSVLPSGLHGTEDKK